MDFLTLDWETKWAQDYSLTSMTTESYIRDPRFEEILIGVKRNAEITYWLKPEQFRDFATYDVDWTNTALITHHAHFDGAILSWKYGIQPALHIDTLSMSRVIDGPKAGNSLEKLALRYNLGEKGHDTLWAKGKGAADFTYEELCKYGAYCCNDVDLTYKLAQIFLPQLPADELRLIDLTVRMFTEPVFTGDTSKLRVAVSAERQRKIELLQRVGLVCPECKGSGKTAGDLVSPFEQIDPPCPRCNGTGVDKKPIGSNDQFANLLRAAGVEPEMKLSPTGNGYIYAFAKTDSFMQSLLDDSDEQVRFLAEARIGVKSNIIETRAQRFLHCAERGAMPVYLSHAGAHTLRPSGGDGMNWLNMSKQIDGMARPEMAVLRQSIQTPPGHKIVSVDSSQGEARILAWLANQQDLVEAFAQGRDVYSEHASVVYGRPVDRKRVKADHIPGQVGKIGILSYGFGSGWYKSATEFLKGALGAPPIQFMVADMETMGIDPSRFLNNTKKIARVTAMPSRLEFNDRVIHCLVADALVYRYRQKYQAITGFWGTCEQVINCMIRGEDMTFGAHGVLRTGKECIHLPGGLRLNYRGIQRSEDGEASYFDGKQRQKIYGSLLTENIVQCLHRLIVAKQMLEIADAGIKVALWPYDEVVVVVPENAAETVKDYMIQVMKTSPDWATGLPLAAEGGVGLTYADC